MDRAAKVGPVRARRQTQGQTARIGSTPRPERRTAMSDIENRGLPLPGPALAPRLDPHFRPAFLACRAFAERAAASGRAVPTRFALEQADGSVFHFATSLCAEDEPSAAGNFTHLERLVKFALWSRG